MIFCIQSRANKLVLNTLLRTDGLDPNFDPKIEKILNFFMKFGTKNK